MTHEGFRQNKAIIMLERRCSNHNISDPTAGIKAPGSTTREDRIWYVLRDHELSGGGRKDFSDPGLDQCDFFPLIVPYPPRSPEREPSSPGRAGITFVTRGIVKRMAPSTRTAPVMPVVTSLPPICTTCSEVKSCSPTGWLQFITYTS